MKNYKIISILLATIMLSMAVIGCTSSNEDTATDDTATQNSEVISDSQTENSEESTEPSTPSEDGEGSTEYSTPSEDGEVSGSESSENTDSSDKLNTSDTSVPDTNTESDREYAQKALDEIIEYAVGRFASTRVITYEEAYFRTFGSGYDSFSFGINRDTNYNEELGCGTIDAFYAQNVRIESYLFEFYFYNEETGLDNYAPLYMPMTDDEALDVACEHFNIPTGKLYELRFTAEEILSMDRTDIDALLALLQDLKRYNKNNTIVPSVS